MESRDFNCIDLLEVYAKHAPLNAANIALWFVCILWRREIIYSIACLLINYDCLLPVWCSGYHFSSNNQLLITIVKENWLILTFLSFCYLNLRNGCNLIYFYTDLKYLFSKIKLGPYRLFIDRKLYLHFRSSLFIVLLSWLYCISKIYSVLPAIIKNILIKLNKLNIQ